MVLFAKTATSSEIKSIINCENPCFALDCLQIKTTKKSGDHYNEYMDKDRCTYSATLEVIADYSMRVCKNCKDRKQWAYNQKTWK